MRILPRHRSSLTRVLATAGVGALILSACTPTSNQEDGGDGAATNDAAGGTADSGAQGGDLAVGLTTDADTLTPYNATQFQSVNVLQNVYETLTSFDENLEVVPALAESWEVSEDGLALTVQLREGVTFHDGSELDAQDVVSSMETVLDEETGAVASASLSAVESVEATDELTVTFTLAAPDAGLPSKLTSVNLAIMSSDDEFGDLENTPNGTGPFAFEDRTPNQSLTLTRNDEYWDGAPSLDSVEFRTIPDETSIMAALQSGNVQFAVLDDPLVADTAGDELNVERTNLLSYHALQMRPDSDGPLSDVNVRLAIACAIDRQGVLDSAMLGEGEVTGPFTSPAFRSDPSARPCPERDLAKAAEYLAQSDYADGVTFTAITSQGGYASSVNEAQAIQAQLAEADITMEIETLEMGTYVDRWVAADFDAAIALNGGNPDPDGMYGRYFTSDGNLNQVAGYSSDTLDQLFAEGRAEQDQDARVAIYDDVARELEDQAVWVWMFTGYSYTVTTDAVQGFTPLANGSLKNLQDVTLSQ